MKLNLFKQPISPAVLAISMLLTTTTVNALDVSGRPLFLGSAGTKNSNIFFVLDDSGSMGWNYLFSSAADALINSNGGFGNDSADFKRYWCSSYNVMAYNPNAVYTPWEGKNDAGNPYPQADITKLHDNPYKVASSTQTGLNDFYIPWHDLNSDGAFNEGECVQNDFSLNSFADCRDQGTWCQLVKDLPANSSTAINTQQNYANWREYYSRREFVMKRALSTVITNLESNAGLDTINRNNSLTTLITDMRVDTNKDALLKSLFKIRSSGGTPLRRALKEAGKYFTEANESPQIAPSPITEEASQCQGNYAILFTDGLWNGGSPNNKGFGGVGDGVKIKNADGDDNTDFDGKAHADSQSARLADVAMHYYEHDLVPSLANEGFITAGVDENPAQHMVTFGVGFGVNGNLSASPAFGSASFAWPNVSSNQISTIDDLRHAAYNGRGEYLSARNPEELAEAFQNIMQDIAQRDASAASFGGNTTEIQVGTVLFQGTLNSRYWSGDLESFSLASDHSVDINHPNWKASDLLKTADNRIIVTSAGTGLSTQGEKFRWAGLPASLKTALGTEEVLNYLRGDEMHEKSQNGDKTFRDRPLSKLGDFVNSAPVYFDQHVFIGGNDGMLHAFNSGTGEEKFAYIPSSVYPYLAELSSPAYSHRFYVDGTVDIKNTGSNTILVGGLNAGGKGIYALDISNMSSGFNSEGAAKESVLWEFTDTSDSDLGLSFSRPLIVKLESGVWAAVFGNGYASGSGKSVLYIVNALTGGLINKIEVGTGEGLSTVKPFDKDDDGDIDFIYAGDLSGQLWRVDLAGSGSSHLLFSAGSGHAITAQPQVIKHPSQPGYMVYFGTGKYIEVADSNNTSVQSFYGIWDDDSSTTVTKTELRQRKILADNVAISGTDFTGRITSSVTDTEADGGGWVDWLGDQGSIEKGWYLDFDTLSAERVITDAIIRDKEIIFTSMIPITSQACKAGGESFLVGLDLEQGTTPDDGLFDINGDGKFDEGDKVSSSYVSGVNLGTGITAKPSILDNSDGSSEAYLNGTQGYGKVKMKGQTIAGKRKSWVQIFL